MPLSAVIITHNARAGLEACLASIAFADEILVIDSGSTDDTLEIARSRGARVIEKAWTGFGAQKQFAVDSACNDWVLCVDADERLSETLQRNIRAELAAPRSQAYALSRCNRFLGRWLRHGEGYPDWVVRLFDRRSARWSDDPVHERVITDVPAARLQGDLLHESAGTLEHYFEKQNRYTTLQAQSMRSQGKRAGVLDLALSPLARFFKFYFLRLGFLDGLPGLVHVSIGCMNSFTKYAKLIELQKSPQ